MFPNPDLGRDPVDIGYLLPDEPEGHPLRCVSFLIPDTLEYRAALYRQVYNLGVTETWDRSDPFKAMLAAEVWTGALQGSFTVFEDDCPVITQIRPDPSGCGNLEQSTDGGATWEDIPGTDYLKRDGTCAMTGGLEIEPVANTEPALTIKPSAPWTQDYITIKTPANLDVWRLFAANNAFNLYNTSGVLKWYVNPDGNNMVFNHTALNLISVANPASWLGININTLRNLTLLQNQRVGVANEFVEATQFLVYTTAAGNVGIKIRPASATPTADHLQIVDSSNVRRAAIASDYSAVFQNQVSLKLQTSITPEQAALLSVAWDDSTYATRKGRFSLHAEAYNGSREIIRGRNDGAQAMIGVLGATPQPRLAITGDTYGIPALDQVVQALALFGWVTDASTSDQALANVCDLRCQIAIGGYTVIATHIFDMAVTIAALSPTSSLAEVIASSQVRAAWDYKIFSPTFAGMVGFFYSYPDQEGMAADLLALYEELIHRVWCELDECGQPNATWQIDIAAALLAWPEDDAHYLIGQAFNTIFSSEADQSLSAGFAVVPFGAVDCSAFDCVFDEPPPPPPPEFDWCREYDFTVDEFWDITGIPPSAGPDGEYVAATGYIGECSGDCAVAIRYIYPEQVNIRRVTCTFIIDEDPIEEPQTPEYSLHYGSAFHLLKAQSFSTEGLKTVVWTGSIDTDRLRIICASGGQVVQGQVTITSVKVEGNSDAPTTDPGADCNV